MAPRRDARAGHTVQFYQDEGFLHERLVGFAAEGLALGEAVVAFATGRSWDAVLRGLGTRGVDHEAAVRAGRLVVRDARRFLDAISGEDGIDHDRFRERVEGRLLQALRQSATGRVRIHGELVRILVEEEELDEALRLEEVWNDVVSRFPCSLLCTYALDAFASAEDTRAFREVARRHHRVIPAESTQRFAGRNALQREVALLQQRARALQEEIDRRTTLEEGLREALEDRRRSERDAIRSRHEAVRAKAEAERANRAKSRFLAMMSHELRTPLTAIIGYQDLLDMELKGPLTEGQRAFVRNIKGAAEELLPQIDQLLGLSRIEAGEEVVERDRIDPILLVGDLAAMIEPLAREKGLGFDVIAPERAVPLETDGRKLRRILLNLASNAVKFTDEGGVELRFRDEGDEVAFEMRDTGAGIPPEDHARIFDPFLQLESGGNGSTRRTRAGVGLGLALSRDLTRLLGGTIALASAPGAGSTFTVSLPVSPVPAAFDSR